MKKYLIPFLAVILAMSLPELGKLLLSFGLAGIGSFLSNEYYVYGIRVIVGLIAIAYFWKQYDEIKVKFDLLAWLAGLGLIIIWIGFDLVARNYGWTFFGTSTASLKPFDTAFPYVIIGMKILGMVVVAAVVEEMFMRSFLIRFFTDMNKWNKLPIGQFNWLSFIATVLIFGFLHSLWFVGILAGIIFNLWLYYRKDMFSCIQCHASANLFLIIYVLVTNDWLLW